MLAMFLAALDQTIVATALPTIGQQFHDVSNLSWVITAYLVSSTAMAPVFGTLSDIYGRRVTITLSLLLFIVGSVAVRARAELDRAHSRSCFAGRRRRGHSSGRADHYRRRDHAARARPVPGLLQRGLGCGRHRWSDPRRRDDRVSRLVGDLLDQPAARRRGDGRVAAQDEAHPAASSASRTRLDGRPAVDVGGDRCAPGADVGRHPLRLALARDPLDDCRGPRAHRHLPVACPPHR